MRGALIPSAQVTPISLDEPLRSVEITPPHRAALLVVRLAGAVIGEILVECEGILTPAAQRAAVSEKIGDRAYQRWLGLTFERSARRPTAPVHSPRTSVVVCTRDRPRDLARCLDSLERLRTRPDEVIVIDSCPGDDRGERVCRDYRVRYIGEGVPGLARARNRGISEAMGELVACTDDDVVVDPGWLDGLAESFADPLVQVVIGYVGPAELATPAQVAFQMGGGFERGFEPAVLEGPWTTTTWFGDGNAIFRRAVFKEIGPYAERFGAGTPLRSAQDTELFHRLLAAGFRIRFDPGRVVWHRHRQTEAELRDMLAGYARGASAYAARCLLRDRDPEGIRAYLLRWRSIAASLWRRLAGSGLPIPFSVLGAEVRGTLSGPWRWLFGKHGPPAVRIAEAESDERAGAGELSSASVTLERPDISVVLAARNDGIRLAEALDSLRQQDYPAEHVELVVAPAGGVALPTGLEGVELLEAREEHMAATLWRAAEAAAHPTILLLDEHLLPERELLSSHAAAQAQADRCVVIGDQVPEVRDTSLLALWLRQSLSDRLGRKAEPDHRWSYLDFCLANSSMPRALFISSGGLDERFSSAPGAERDLGQRLLEAGASFRHGARARARRVLIENVAGVLRERRCEGRDDVLLASKHPGLRPSLRLASVLTAQGEGLAFPRLLPVADPALRVGQPALGLVEALKLRTAWRALLERLLSLSYLLGVHEALHPAAERPELTRSLRSGDGVRRVELELDSGGPLGLDPLLAATELDVTWRGRSLARVAALEAGDSWEWERLTRRVVEGGAAPLVRLGERSPEARSELAPPGLRADDDDRGSAAQTGG